MDANEISFSTTVIIIILFIVASFLFDNIFNDTKIIKKKKKCTCGKHDGNCTLTDVYTVRTDGIKREVRGNLFECGAYQDRIKTPLKMNNNKADNKKIINDRKNELKSKLSILQNDKMDKRINKEKVNELNNRIEELEWIESNLK